MSYLAGKRVGIAGAGIAGTAFALALDQACREHHISPLPNIQIFERDASATARANIGYSFSLRDHGDAGSGGLQVLRLLQRGLEEELILLQEPSNGMHICWQNFKPILQLREEKRDDGAPVKAKTMRISRSRVRAALLRRIEPERIHYGKVCVSAVAPTREGAPAQLKFVDGSETECDILVVADGASSKVRAALLPHEANAYAGVCMLYGRTKPLQQLPALLYQGLYLSMGKADVSNFMCSVDGNTVMWSLSFPAPESKAAELNALFRDPAAAQRFLETEVPRLADGFAEPLPSVLQDTPAASLAALPAMDKAPHPVHDTGIVYIGDAWHAMSPFSGSGANMALADAWFLAQELANGSHPSAQAAITAFAAKNAERSTVAINGSHRIIFMAHSQGLTKLLIVLFLKTMGLVLGMTAGSLAWIRLSRHWPRWLSMSPARKQA